MKRYNKSEIMRHAWRLFRAGVNTFAEALRKAWYFAKDALEMIDLFSVEAMSVCTTPYKPKTDDERYMGYIHGRMAYMKKNKP